MRAGLPFCLLLACGSPAHSPAPAPAPTPAPEPAPAPAPATPAAEPQPVPATPARRCLPVVAAECGCVYSCGLGTEASPGRWSVAHEHWAPHPVGARVDRWCVDGQCTDAFLGEIVCSGICPPKPADPHCRLAGDRCESTAPAPIPATIKKISEWPFHEWDRAEAITYNHVPYGPGVPLRVYDATHGWSPKIVERKPITAEQARHAASWVRATGGEVEVSKCAFPRHAVVLYAGDIPVGTANVCFECGDILVWPDITAPTNSKKQMTAYKKVFPEWEHLFRDELGFSLTPPQHP